MAVIAILCCGSNICEKVFLAVNYRCIVSAFSEIQSLMNCFLAQAQFQYKRCFISSYLVNCSLVTGHSLRQEHFGHPEPLPVFNTVMI
jgi:hypothetical protein